MTENSISDMPFLIDFSDLYRFSNTAAKYDGTFDTNGDFEFTKAPDGTECMRLVYSPTDASMNDYRFLFSLKDPAVFSEAYRYVRVTYMTDDTRAATLSLRNNCERHTALLVKNTAPYAANGGISTAVLIPTQSPRAAHMCTFLKPTQPLMPRLCSVAQAIAVKWGLCSGACRMTDISRQATISKAADGLSTAARAVIFKKSA